MQFQCDESSHVRPWLRVLQRHHEKMSESLGFQHKVSAAYHLQTNDLTKRMVWTIKNHLQKRCGNKTVAWDERLSFVLFSILHSSQACTNKCLLIILYGVEPMAYVSDSKTLGSHLPLTKDKSCGPILQKLLPVFEETVYDLSSPLDQGHDIDVKIGGSISGDIDEGLLFPSAHVLK